MTNRRRHPTLDRTDKDGLGTDMDHRRDPPDNDDPGTDMNLEGEPPDENRAT